MQEHSWETLSEEITINLEAPIHLSMLFIPQLMKQDDPAIINVTSALAFVPLAIAPIYSATKAALHSFTLSLRQQLIDRPYRCWKSFRRQSTRIWGAKVYILPEWT